MRTTTASQLTRTISASRPSGISGKRAVGAEAGVVDQQLDLDTELGDPGGQRGGVGAEVAAEHAGLGGQLGGERLEAVGAAGDEDEVVAARGELAGELLADSRGGSGDQGRSSSRSSAYS